VLLCQTCDDLPWVRPEPDAKVLQPHFTALQTFPGQSLSRADVS